MNRIYSCSEHIDIAIEKMLDTNTFPIVENELSSTKCELCESEAVYIVRSGEAFED